MKKLNVFYDLQKVGSLYEDSDERLSFKYDPSWVNSKNNFSLSLVLKVREEKYEHLATKSFFENLLPEGKIKQILEKSSKQKIKDEFNFLKNYGLDCAGAFIITESEHIEKATKFKNKEIKLDKIYKYLDQRKSLTEAIINREGGKFSLAGAQDKFPIIYRKNKIFLPLDGEPTTHILKPHVIFFDETHDSPYNEYFCMNLAKSIGLNVPEVHLINGKYPLYLIERFDRSTTKDKIIRIHGQDFCQAQGLTSKNKYEDEGGPTLQKNYNLIKINSSLPLKDLDQFIKWIWFNLFIGNHDCHSKNLSFTNTREGLRLSPFYDILSTVIYKNLTNNFSYSIGKQFIWYKLKNTNFKRLANDFEINIAILIKTGSIIAKKIESKMANEISKFEKKYPNIDTAKKIEKETLKRIHHLQIKIPSLKTNE